MRRSKSKYFLELIICFSVLFFGILLSPVKTSAQVYNELPDHYPNFSVELSNNPDHGYYFLSGRYQTATGASYLIILDTAATTVFYQEKPYLSGMNGFTLQENGLLSYCHAYFNPHENEYRILDSTYKTVMNLKAANGFITDIHELILLDDNSYWLLAQDWRTIDMSKIVPDGHPNATVIGAVVQHIDEAGQVLFEWNSFDHIGITECDTNFVDLTHSSVDYVHANALAIDYDGHILMSNRHLNEITKIDINTGDIIWRWGGKMNQFTFQGAIPFSGQHCIRYNASENTYSLFDNGNFHDSKISRVLEFELDQTNLTATLINIFSHDPELYTAVMGGTQRLENGGTIANWTANNDHHMFTEFDAAGDEVLEVRTIGEERMISYRVLKQNWSTSLFKIMDDSLDFEEVYVGDSAFLTLSIKNNQSEPLAINGFNIRDTLAFTLQTTLPVIIEPEGTQNFSIKFKPLEEKNYISVLSMFHSTDTSRVAQQIKLCGGGLIVDTPEHPFRASPKLDIYPNPMSSSTAISLSNKESIQQIMVVDLSGRILIEQKVNDLKVVNLSVGILNTGIYYILIHSAKAKYTGKLVVIK